MYAEDKKAVIWRRKYNYNYVFSFVIVHFYSVMFLYFL